MLARPSRPLYWPLAISFTFLLPAFGCGDDGGGSPADATADDTGTAADAGDAGPSGADSFSDDSAEDGAVGSDAAAGDDVSEGPTCTTPEEVAPSTIDASQSKFAMSLFHYNVEYVIGGLETTTDDGEHLLLGDFAEAEGWDNDRVEDWIITDTLLPMLEMYERHPTWRVDFEMQAYMVEVMAARHPETLALMRELAWAGQVELISFHYAAQLFLAFPREEQLRSIARTHEVFEDHCLPLSGVVFNQEGQAGEGRQRTLVEHGYEIGVHPKNLWNYVRHGEVPWPWYASEGGTLVVGPGGVDPASGVEVVWDFFDDGELRSVPEGVNPYVAMLFNHDPERVAEFEAHLEAREADGYSLVTIGEYARHLEARGVEKKQAPALLDGTWQPPSTDSIHRWLGGRSQVWHVDEEDNVVRAGNTRTRMHVHATQVVLDAADAAGVATPALMSEVEDMWLDLMHAEVSDASGVNPWRGEILWCERLNDELHGRALVAIDSLAELLDISDDHLTIDLHDGTLTAAADAPAGDGAAPLDTPPLAVAVRADEREITETWWTVPDDTVTGRWRYALTFATAVEEPDCDECDGRRVELRFPRTADVIEYSPGLIEDEVRSYPFSDFVFQFGHAWLPLPNGLIGLGEGWYVIKHVRTGHIAARIGPDFDDVAFIDATPQRDHADEYVFEIVQTDTAAAALAIANRINTWPAPTYVLQD